MIKLEPDLHSALPPTMKKKEIRFCQLFSPLFQYKSEDLLPEPSERPISSSSSKVNINPFIGGHLTTVRNGKLYFKIAKAEYKHNKIEWKEEEHVEKPKTMFKCKKREVSILCSDFRVTYPNTMPSFSPRNSTKEIKNIYIEVPYKEYHPPPKDLDEFLAQHQDEFLTHLLSKIPSQASSRNSTLKNRNPFTSNNQYPNSISTTSLLQTLPPLSPVLTSEAAKDKRKQLSYQLHYKKHPHTHPFPKDYIYKGDQFDDKPKWVNPAKHYYFHPIEAANKMNYNDYTQTVRTVASYPASPIKLCRIDPEYIYLFIY